MTVFDFALTQTSIAMSILQSTVTTGTLSHERSKQVAYALHGNRMSHAAHCILGKSDVWRPLAAPVVAS